MIATLIPAAGELLTIHHDRQFNEITQTLKVGRGTSDYKFGEGSDGDLGCQVDWSNRPNFQTNQAGMLSDHQLVATLGLVW
jgi:hypothetical protein